MKRLIKTSSKGGSGALKSALRGQMTYRTQNHTKPVIHSMYKGILPTRGKK